jgi:hypothetical protein
MPRALLIVGLVAMVAGVLDPLEGSVVILPAIVLATVGAALGGKRHRITLYWALSLVTVGVAALWGISALGGFGGHTGRSMWWALILLPYPIGWILGLVGAVRSLRERPAPAAPTA